MLIQDLYQIYLQYPLILTDTRKLQPGGIFFALKGGNFDGNTFAQQALGAGASFVVIDDPIYAVSDQCILVDDVLQTLQELAHYHRMQMGIPFIAITGSNGKTTTKELVATVLGKRYITYATEGNLNNHIGVPLTLLKIKQDAQMAIIEMGANHQKEIAGYCKIAAPTHGIITNCGKAHIEGFGGEEGVRKGKGELYDYLRVNNGIAFRNADLDYLTEMAVGITEQVTYGSTDAKYTGKPLLEGVFLSVAVFDNEKEQAISTNLVGGYNFPNVMTAVAIGRYFGVPFDEIKQAIEYYAPDNSRSQLVQKGSNKLILDAYNANPSSLRAAILNFAVMPTDNKVLWIGGMKEMGSEEANEHKALVALIAEYNWVDVLLVGKEFRDVHNGYAWFENSADAAVYIKKHVPENCSILIKGSRGSKMEVLADALPN